MSIAPEVEKLLKSEGVSYDISGYEWAKTVIYFTDEDEPIMAVLPASYHVSQEKLAALVGASSLRLAEESDFAGLYPNCEPGAMPPLGNLYGQRTFVDQRLAEDEEIVFNAGNHSEAVRMRYADYERLARPEVGGFTGG
jgi:Ala-tRNA(Pro) deacylase